MADDREKLLRQAGIKSGQTLNDDSAGPWDQVDLDFFRHYPDRSHMVRSPLPGEVEGSVRQSRQAGAEIDVPAAGGAQVVVRQVEEGAHVRRVIWLREPAPNNEETAHALFDTAERGGKITTVEEILARQVKPGKH